MDFVQSKFDVINIAEINVIVDAANLHVSALKNEINTNELFVMCVME